MLWVHQWVTVLHAHPSLHPCLMSGDVLDGTLLPQFTLLQAGMQGKPGALSLCSDSDG